MKTFSAMQIDAFVINVIYLSKYVIYVSFICQNTFMNLLESGFIVETGIAIITYPVS